VGRRRSKEQSESSQLKPKQSKAKTDSITKQLTQYSETEQSIAADLSYSEARMALELSLAQLQASDLDVESMTGLFNRAQGYADRCETLLKRVEQEVALWDSDNPEQAPQPYRSA
jgi:exodeoxyribonuclease VII small subunit